MRSYKDRYNEIYARLPKDAFVLIDDDVSSGGYKYKGNNGDSLIIRGNSDRVEVFMTPH